MSKTTYLIFAILFSALSIIYPAIILVRHPHGYVICTYLYTALTASCGAMCWVGHAFKSNPQRTNTEQNAEIKQLTKELEAKKKECREIANDYQEMGTAYYNETIESAELQKQVDELKARLHMIFALGFDYDGCDKAESLKGLIDELVKITQMDSKEFADYYKGVEV